MIGLITVYRARRAAVSVIAPLVESSRERLGQDFMLAAWLRPYIVGFLSMLITLIAREETGRRLSDDMLARTQLDAWRAITGLDDDRIGEDICLLSAAREERFMAGCADAVRFASAYYGLHVDPPLVSDEAIDAWDVDVAGHDVDAAFRYNVRAERLWRRSFEANMRP